jgi:hypothetical protein
LFGDESVGKSIAGFAGMVMRLQQGFNLLAQCNVIAASPP